MHEGGPTFQTGKRTRSSLSEVPPPDAPPKEPMRALAGVEAAQIGLGTNTQVYAEVPRTVLTGPGSAI